MTDERYPWPVVNVAQLGVDLVTVTCRRERRWKGVDIVETVELVVDREESPRIGDHAYLDIHHWIRRPTQ